MATLILLGKKCIPKHLVLKNMKGLVLFNCKFKIYQQQIWYINNDGWLPWFINNLRLFETYLYSSHISNTISWKSSAL